MGVAFCQSKAPKAAPALQPPTSPVSSGAAREGALDPKTTLILSVAAFLIGVFSWALPSWKYHRTTTVGSFAPLLLLVGVLLMTVFKWGEIALEVSGAKLQIKQAQQQISRLESELIVTRMMANSAQAMIQVTENDLAATLAKSFAENGIAVDTKVVKAVARQAVGDKNWQRDGDPSPDATKNLRFDGTFRPKPAN